MKRFKSVMVCLIIFLLLSSCYDDSSAAMERMKQQIPEVTEIFVQSREHLEVLRVGEFGARMASADSLGGRLTIGYEVGMIRVDGNWQQDLRFVRYEDWHTIEWLSEEEREALVFLLSSEELSRNFLRISGGLRTGCIRARVHDPEAEAGSFMEIWHDTSPNPLWARSIRDSYSVSFELGYRLWIYTVLI